MKINYQPAMTPGVRHDGGKSPLRAVAWKVINEPRWRLLWLFPGLCLSQAVGEWLTF